MIVNCDKCGNPVNDRSESVWNFVTGWEKKREGGGTNHIALRTPQNQFRCNVCMQRMLDGVDPEQQTIEWGPNHPSYDEMGQ